jgi:hypothetical protein
MLSKMLIVFLITTIVLVIRLSSIIVTPEKNISYIRTKRFLFGFFTRDKTNCQAKGRQCYGQNSMRCSIDIVNILFFV